MFKDTYNVNGHFFIEKNNNVVFYKVSLHDAADRNNFSIKRIRPRPITGKLTPEVLNFTILNETTFVIIPINLFYRLAIDMCK